MYPDFIGIGAQKAGTTWLYQNLRAHPEIWMPEEKEIHYFDEKIKLKGGIWTRLRGDSPADQRWRRQVRVRLRRIPQDRSAGDLSWAFKYFLGRPDDDWYASLFGPGKGKITGESTPDYSILNKAAISHVHDLMPGAKIIFMMRSPIERPWSVLNMGFRSRGEETESVPDETFDARLENRRKRRMTSYLRTLKNWSTFYPEDQIFVGFLEDVRFFPEELLRRLHEFLGVTSSFDYQVLRRRINSGRQSTMPTRSAARLSEVYRGQIRALSRRFGGYADFWLYCAERLVDDPPPEQNLPYPLWESSLWEDWISSDTNRPQVRSGPLPCVKV